MVPRKVAQFKRLIGRVFYFNFQFYSSISDLKPSLFGSALAFGLYVCIPGTGSASWFSIPGVGIGFFYFLFFFLAIGYAVRNIAVTNPNQNKKFRISLVCEVINIENNKLNQQN